MANHADVPEAAAGGPRFADAVTFGGFLRSHRSGRNITLQQIANETKVPERHLLSLERGDITQWPAGIYRRAMIRAYALAVGLDPDEMAVEFAKLFDHTNLPPEESVAAVTQKGGRLTFAAPRESAIVFTFCAAAAIAFAWYGLSIARGMTQPGQPIVHVPVARFEAEGTTGRVLALGPSPAERWMSALPEAVEAHALPAVAAEAQAMATRVGGAVSEAVLHVTSNPSGAQVTVNGIRWGETPLTIRHLAPGEKRVRITKDGHVSIERAVLLTYDGTPRTLAVDLEASP